MFLKQENSDSELLYSTFKGESIPFVIGDSSVIIDIIRKKIYSYPLRTMVQEYLSNAKDACVEAGKDPSSIEVTLPTQLKPEFIVRDHGVGMSDERIREVFVQYGISTKRTSTSQLGYFGIGSKSGWAYTDSFIVESFYNGIHRQYIADIGDNKEGRLLLHTESPTQEENGVLIKIPVESKDIHEFKDAYVRATCFWKQKPTLKKESVPYPKPSYLLDGVVLYEISPVFYAYSPSPNPKLAGIYLNANGIPFDTKYLYDQVHIHDNTNLTTFAQFCQNNSILLAIEIDPALLGISANRESFSNQKYANKKISSASETIKKYIENEFQKVEPSQYIQTYKNLGILTELREDFFKDKPYGFFTRYKTTNITISKGYFSKIEHGMRFYKSVHVSIVFEDITEIYLSRSKVLIEPDKENLKAPEFEPETRKALMAVKNHIMQIGVRSNIFVFFQDSLSNDEYREIAAIVGAKQYLEDAFKDVKLVKVPKKVNEPNKYANKIFVRRFESPRRYNTFAIRSNHLIDMDTLQNQTFECILYGESCSINFLRCISHLFEIFPCLCVHASPSNLIKLNALNNPKIIHTDKFKDFIRSKPDIINTIADQQAYQKNKSVWEFLHANNKVGIEVVSKKFDIRKLRDRASFFIRKMDITGIESFIGKIGIKSELEDFINTYPLLKLLSGYNFSTDLLPHINAYIKSIDEGFL